MGSTAVRTFPKLIAAYHVLHRLLPPRHPPNALRSLDRSHLQCSPVLDLPSRSGEEAVRKDGHSAGWHYTERPEVIEQTHTRAALAPRSNPSTRHAAPAKWPKNYEHALRMHRRLTPAPRLVPSTRCQENRYITPLKTALMSGNCCSSNMDAFGGAPPKARNGMVEPVGIEPTT